MNRLRDVIRPACNLDSRGKAVRLVSGLLVCIASVALIALWALPAGGWKPWTLTLLILLFGLFQIYEAWSGWCIVRAMGFKTPI